MIRTRWVAACVAALLLSLAVTCFASDSNLRPDTKVMFTAQTIAASGNATSASFSAIGQSTHMSLQFRNTGTSASFKLEVLCSLDEVNYVKPETGGDLGTFSDGNFHVVAVSPPFCKQVRFKCTELGGVNPVILDATACSQ